MSVKEAGMKIPVIHIVNTDTSEATATKFINLQEADYTTGIYSLTPNYENDIVYGVVVPYTIGGHLKNTNENPYYLIMIDLNATGLCTVMTAIKLSLQNPDQDMLQYP